MDAARSPTGDTRQLIYLDHAATTPLDPNDPETYSYSTALKIFDSLGKEHSLSLYFVRRTDVVNSTWDVYTVLDNDTATLPATPNVAPDDSAAIEIAFGEVRADEVDLGIEGDENDPADVVAGGSTYAAYGPEETFVCDETGCTTP